MTQIVTTLEQVREILPSYNLKTTGSMTTRMNDFLVTAQAWVVETIIGETLEQYVLSILGSDTQTADQLALLKHLRRVICVKAYLTAIGEMDLQLSEAGFVVQMNDKMSPASQQRVDRLTASLEERLARDCDRLVDWMIHSDRTITGAVNQWKGSEECAYLTQAFMPTMAELKRACRNMPVGKWDDFHALQPTLHDILYSTVANYVGSEQIDTLLELYRDDDLVSSQRSVIRMIRMAIGAEAEGLYDNARHFAATARNHMLSHLEDFADFAESENRNMPGIDFGDGAVANLL